MSERDTFVFYESYITALEGWDDRVFRNVITTICNYAFHEQEPEFPTGTIERSLFEMARKNIDANNKRYESGKRGGRPSKTEKPVVSDKKPMVSKSKPVVLNSKPVVSDVKTSGYEPKTSGYEGENQWLGVSVSVSDTVSDSDTVSVYEGVSGKVSKDETNKNQNPPDFIPPSKKAVHGYIALKSQIKGIKPDFDEDKFLNYYNARGWMSGNTKITDWKAAVDSWLERSGKFSQNDDEEDPFADLKGSF